MIAVFGAERDLHEIEVVKQIHMERLTQGLDENGKTKQNWDEKLLAESTPFKIFTGIYVERIVDLSLTEACWVVDFYIWFRWNDKQVQPGSVGLYLIHRTVSGIKIRN